MRDVAIAVFVVFLSSCSMLASGGGDTLVRVQNDSSVTFTKVVLELGNTERSHVVFKSVTPSSATKFASVENAFSQPYTVLAETNGEQFRVDVEAAFPIPLESGSYTYTLSFDEANRLRVTPAQSAQCMACRTNEGQQLGVREFQ